MKTVIVAIGVMFIGHQSFTQHIAKYAGEFISIGVGGRALGLGGAYSALASDASAGYWNPAALGRIDFPEIMLMHDERFGGLLNYDFCAVAIPVRTNASIGVSIMRLGVDGLPDSRKAGINADGNLILDGQYQNFVGLDYEKITYFNSSDWAAYITYADRSTSGFLYGINLKILYRSMAEFSATGIGFDIGLLYPIEENWNLAATIQDITTTLIAWSHGTHELISPTVKLGTVYFFHLFGGQFAATTDLDMRIENRKFASTVHLGPVSLDPHVGLEFDYKNSVALRVGYSDVKQMTLGVGLHLRKLDIDYSFARFSKQNNLGDTHRISLRLILQGEKFARSKE